MFSAILYWLIIKPISLLPHRVLYAISDFLFFVFYYIFPYRKKVVLDNLRKSFPEKTEAEIQLICKGFYHHFCDIVLESLKNFSISREQAQSRMTQSGLEVLEKYHREGKSVILCGGHYNNWELWAVASPHSFSHKLVAIYKKLSNLFFDKKMRDSRSRFGLTMISTKEIGDYMRIHKDELSATVFAFDQSPSNPKKCVWVNFLGRETAALYGAEKFAREYNLPVVYGHIYKVSRGKYAAHYELLTDDPSSCPEGDLIQQMHTILEKDIRKAPQYWLWSHRRWKHQRPNDENFQENAF